MSINRRRFLKAVAAAGVAPLSIPSARVFAQTSVPRVTYATLNNGVSVIFNEYLKAKRPDRDNGVDIQITNNYTSVASYYNDLIAGTFELGIGAWDTYLSMYRRGVPVSLSSTVTTGTMINIAARRGGPASIKDLRGKTISAIASSGAYNMCRAVIARRYGLTLGKDISVQNVPSPSEALTLLLAGNVDAALSWEPSLAIVFAKDPKLQSIFNLGREYQEIQKQDLPYFGFAVRNEALQRHPDLQARLAKTFRQLVDGMNANLTETFELAAPVLKVAPKVLMAAHDEGRLIFSYHSMSDQVGREIVRSANAFTDGKDNPAINDSFFAG